MNNVTDIDMRASLAAASLVILSCVAPAHAALIHDPEVLSKTVEYSDLNLQSDAGARALYGRIRGAAKDVCAPLVGSELVQQSAWKSCVERAISNSVAQVNVSRVTALHYDARKTARRT